MSTDPAVQLARELAALRREVDALSRANPMYRRDLPVERLVAGEIAAGQRIIAGPESGTHAEMASDGFRVFKDDPVDGVPNEVVRMGTQTNDFIGIVGADGELLASVDETGRGNFQGLTVVGDPTIGGRPLSTMLNAVGGRQVGRWSGTITGLEGQSGLGIRSEYGIGQFTFPCVAGRAYLIHVDGPWWYFHQGGEDYAGTDEASLRLRQQKDAAVTLSSEQITEWTVSGIKSVTFQRPNRTFVWHATYTGTCNLGLTMKLNNPSNSSSAIRVVHGSDLVLSAFDQGPSHSGTAGNQSNMGGGLYQGPPAPPPPPPTQQYYVDLAPVGFHSWRGNNTLRSDVGGPVQGWDPSGYNGDGKGHWWFDLPSITGTIDRMDFYAYSAHWYYNAGGTAILNASLLGNGGPNYAKPRGDWHVGGWPKPGGKTVTLPADWYPLFRNGGAYGYGRADGITVGPSGGSNLNYYGRFDGPSARLRIWYTQ